MLGFTGVTAIVVSEAGVTVSVAPGERTPPNCDLITVEPCAAPVAKPVLLMVATPVIEEDHVAQAVNSCGVVSISVPVAVNCWVVPLAMLAVAGDTASEDNEDDVNVARPDGPP